MWGYIGWPLTKWVCWGSALSWRKAHSLVREEEGVLGLSMQSFTGNHRASDSSFLGWQAWPTMREVSLLIFGTEPRQVLPARPLLALAFPAELGP